MEFKCDYNKCKRKPFAEVYPYKKCKKSEDAEFIGLWSYLCLFHFIKLKLKEKIIRGNFKYAWCSAERSE